MSFDSFEFFERDEKEGVGGSEGLWDGRRGNDGRGGSRTHRGSSRQIRSCGVDRQPVFVT